ncbi:MAG: TolC family protein, partial [Polyangiaceae bacterium]
PQALAQPAPAATTQPAQPAPAPPAPAAAASPQPGADAKPAPPALETKPDVLVQTLSKQPGGLSLDEVARLALKTKPGLRAKQAELAAAAAKVDQAYVNYFPRLSVAFTYTRLSPVENPFAAVAGFTGSKVEFPKCPDNPADDPSTPTDESDRRCGFFDNYNFTASVAIPVSDYLLRITQGHAAASHAEKSKKIEVEAETLTSAADAKVAYLNWVRAQGQLVVAREAAALARAHVEDVKRLKTVGLASQADVLRGDAQVAAADQAVVEVEAFASIAQEQVRIGLGLPKDKPLAVGIDVFNVSPPATLPDLAAAQSQAMEKRLEIRSLDETELSLKEVESVTRAGFYPRVDLFADLTIANPNQRYPFSGQDWNTTWDAGVRASWTFNDTFTTIGAAAESKARVTQIAETKKQVRDGLRLEVTAAWTELKKSGASIDAATRALTASEEGLRVRRELFLQGKATNVEMLDAETEVIRAKLRKLDAQIALLVNQIKFDHAVGNDVGTVKPSDASSSSDDDASAKKTTQVAKADVPVTSDAGAAASASPAKPVPPPLLPLAK